MANRQGDVDLRFAQDSAPQLELWLGLAWGETPEAIAAVNAIVKENRRVTVHEIITHLDMSHGSAYHIFHDVLQFHKMSASWVPHQLTAEFKNDVLKPARNFRNALKQKVMAF